MRRLSVERLGVDVSTSSSSRLRTSATNPRTNQSSENGVGHGATLCAEAQESLSDHMKRRSVRQSADQKNMETFYSPSVGTDQQNSASVVPTTAMEITSKEPGNAAIDAIQSLPKQVGQNLMLIQQNIIADHERTLLQLTAQIEFLQRVDTSFAELSIENDRLKLNNVETSVDRSVADHDDPNAEEKGSLSETSSTEVPPHDTQYYAYVAPPEKIQDSAVPLPNTPPPDLLLANDSAGLIASQAESKMKPTGPQAEFPTGDRGSRLNDRTRSNTEADLQAEQPLGVRGSDPLNIRLSDGSTLQKRSRGQTVVERSLDILQCRRGMKVQTYGTTLDPNAVRSGADSEDFNPDVSFTVTQIRNRSRQDGAAGDDEEAITKSVHKTQAKDIFGIQRGVFPDAEEMKERIRKAIGKEQIVKEMYYYDTGICQFCVRAWWFEHVTLAVIGLNAIWIWIDTDYNPEPVLSESKWPFQVAEHMFTVFFLAEWILRFGALEWKFYLLKDAWFVFDSLLVAIMIVDSWIMGTLLYIIAGGNTHNIGDASILRMARLFRLTRMARVVRLLRAFPELMILIKGIIVATRSVFFTLTLLAAILYVFGIAFTQLAEGTPMGRKYFHSVPRSMCVLLLHCCLGENLPDVVYDVGNQNYGLAFLLLVFVLMAALTVMNMLVGILCEVISLVSAIEKEQMMVNFTKSRIVSVLEVLGVEESQLYTSKCITKCHFESLIQNPTASLTLQEVGVDVVGLVDYIDIMFKDGNALSFGDFMELILQLRGSNKATVKDIVDLRKFLAQELTALSIFEKKMSSEISSLHDRLERSLRGHFKRAAGSLGSLGSNPDDANRSRKALAPNGHHPPVMSRSGDQREGNSLTPNYRPLSAPMGRVKEESSASPRKLID